MGKGDKKTRRGKIFLGTYGVRRRKKKISKPEIAPVAVRVKEVKGKRPAREKKVVKEAIEVNTVKETRAVKVAAEVKETKVVKDKKEVKATKVVKGKKEAAEPRVEKAAKVVKPVKAVKAVKAVKESPKKKEEKPKIEKKGKKS